MEELTNKYLLRTSHGMKHVYKQMRPRHEDDYYPTPYELCYEALYLGADYRFKTQFVLDVGCGTGVWGMAAKRLFYDPYIIGIEIDPIRACLAWETGAYNEVFIGDFLTHKFATEEIKKFNLIIGNPPYKHAEGFLMRAYDMLYPNSEIVFLLRLAFLESQGRYKRLFSSGKKPKQIMPLVERPSFTGNGKTDATAYAVFTWQNNMYPYDDTVLRWLSWR